MPKRHNEHLKISDALQEFVKDNRLQTGLDKVNVYEAWHKLLGKGISNYTTAVDLKKNTLYVQLSSSVLREELGYGKEKIITMLNEALGKDLIKKLVLR